MCSMGTHLPSRKGLQQPPPTLLWHSRPSQQLLSSCLHLVACIDLYYRILHHVGLCYGLVNLIPFYCCLCRHLFSAHFKAVFQLYHAVHFGEKCVCVTGVDGLSVVIAAGPFSTSDNILYEPLSDLVSCLSGDSPPDVCILVCTAVLLVVDNCPLRSSLLYRRDQL